MGTLAACGDNTQSKVCGEGTVDNGEGVCVAGGGTCGPGTILVGDECVPDGSVICGDGTIFNPATGECDPDVCEAGQVLVDGNCIDEGSVDVDAEEAAEPNDGDAAGELAGEIVIPGIGEDGFVIHGCVNPYRDVDGDGNPDVDYDYWLIDASSPMALHIVADGVSGLAAGFIMLAGDPDLVNDGWQRFGINLVNDRSERELYLPKAGIYVLAMTDSRSLFLDAAGGPDACYYTSVQQIALPAATPGTGSDDGTHDGTLSVFSFDPADGDLFDNILNEGSTQVLSSLTVLKNGAYLTSVTETTDFFGNPIPAEAFTAGYADSDTLSVVVDPIYDYSLAPQDYTLVTTTIGAQALPTAGTDVTVTPTGAAFFGVLADLNWLYFDVTTDGEIVHFDVDFNGDDANLLIVDSDLLIMAAVSFPDDPTVPGFGPADSFVRFPTAGRYYAVVFRPGEPAANTWTLTSTLIAATPSAIVAGTPVDDASLPGTGSAFFTFDGQSVDWGSITASSPNGGAQVIGQVYDAAGFGWLENGYNPLVQYDFASAGGTVFEHIFIQEPRDFVIRVQTTAPTAATTFDVSISEVPYIDLGTIVAGTPLVRTGDAFVDDAFQRYVAFTDPANSLDITASPNTATPLIDIIMQSLFIDFESDPLLRNIDYITRADSGFDGDPETLSTGVSGAPAWVAFAVGDYFGAAGTIDLDVTALAPRPYVITTGTLAYADACTGTGVTIMTGADESNLPANALPASFANFELFGENVGGIIPRVSSNGFLAFNPSSTGAVYLNVGIPNTALPNGILAPYWSDIDFATVCQKTVAGNVVFQWNGSLYQVPSEIVQFQIVLHPNGVIDYIYGAAQTADGSEVPGVSTFGATIGAETTGGLFGQEIAFDEVSVTPATSTTLTPE